MKIPEVLGFEAEFKKIQEAIDNDNEEKNELLFIPKATVALTDYARNLIAKNYYNEAEEVLEVALENDKDGMNRNAIKLLYDIYIKTGRNNELNNLRRYDQFIFIEDLILKKEDNIDVKTFLKSISIHKKDPAMYVNKILNEVTRIKSEYSKEALDLQFEIVKYQIKCKEYEKAWKRLNELHNESRACMDYFVLSKIE